MITGPDVTASFDWRAVLLRKLAERDCAEAMLSRNWNRTETSVITIALISIEDSAARAIHNLGGLASPW